jgi:hypothetical protein
MTKEEIEYATIKNTVSILAVMCSANTSKIIDRLTGYLWDEEEAQAIKRAGHEYNFKIEQNGAHE